MNVLLGLTALAVLASATLLARRSLGVSWPEATVLGGPVGLSLWGIEATVWAWAGILTPITLAISSGITAGVLAVPLLRARTSESPAPSSPRGCWAWSAPLVVLVVAGALRLPVSSFPMGGRDQGTYALRAASTMRTGALGWTDPTLAAAGRDREVRAGSWDVLSCYPKTDAPWRQGIYEAAYRPGFYLADRDAGRVVPQFLHLHPLIMASAGLVVGTGGWGAVVWLEGLLAVLAVYCIAARALGHPAWGALAGGWMAIAPVAIWVHRTTLSEALAGALLGAVVVGALVARDGDERALGWSALALGAVSWVRGDGWITTPPWLAVMWLGIALSPGSRRHVRAFVVVVLASVVVHVETSFPYLHDELLRILGPEARITPGRIGLVAVGIAAGSLVATTTARPIGSRWAEPIARRAPIAALGLTAIGIGGWAWGYAGASGPPFSRLDPAVAVLGGPLLIAAGAGAILVARRARSTTAADLWLCGWALATATMVVFFARRSLPQVGLYYYGRYLVPQVLPAACLLATAALAALWEHGGDPTTRRVARSGVIAAIGAITWGLAGVLVTAPQTRLDEFAGAGALASAIADATPADAIVVAGGEGWHHSHTFNQVGGALAGWHGRTVLPYRNREQAWATLYELLVAGPSHRGEPAPPVYLLLNEATQAMSEGPAGPRWAALDDRISAPFVGTSMLGAELFVHRLTPTDAAIPTRVTRDELRMALIEVHVADPHLREVHPSHCDRDGGGVRLRFPPDPSRGSGQLVVRFDAGFEGHPRLSTAARPGAPRRTTFLPELSSPRATLGPLAFPDGVPSELTLEDLHAFGSPCEGAERRLQVWWLPDPTASGEPTTTSSFGPPRDLGHPPQRTRWVRGLSLSSHRPTLDRPAARRGPAIRLSTTAPLAFAPTKLSAHGERVRWVLSLSERELSSAAEVELANGGVLLGRWPVPAGGPGLWQSAPLPDPAGGRWVRPELRLVTADPSAQVWVRDVAVFLLPDGPSGTLPP